MDFSIPLILWWILVPIMFSKSPPPSPGTLYGQLEGTKWLLVAINKTEIGTRVLSPSRPDVESKSHPGVSDDCQPVGVDQ